MNRVHVEFDGRKSGIEAIGNVPWGTHFCQFYQTKEDLIEILVPYFKTGLENNEFCMWITSTPLEVDQAKAALGKVVKDLDERISKYQVEILDRSEWHTRSGEYQWERVLKGWLEKERKAIERGFDGLRLAENMFSLERNAWVGFTEYEAEIKSTIAKHKMMALCSYPLDRRDASEVLDVVDNHQFALVRRKRIWDILQNYERKKINSILQRTREASSERQRLFNILETLPVMICLLTKDYDVTFANRSFREKFGESGGRHCYEYCYQQKEPCKFCGSYKVFETGKPQHWQITKPDDNRIFDVYDFPFIDADGSSMILEMNVDITEQKHAEAELRKHNDQLNELVRERTAHLLESEQKYSTMFEKSRFPKVLVKKLGGNIVSVNDAFLKLFEFTQKEVIGNTIMGLGILDPISLGIATAQVSGNGLVRDFECTHITKSGDKRILSLDLDSISLGGNEHVVTTIQDVTERKRLESLKDQFISTITHELRTPLVSIIGYTDYMLSGRQGSLPQKIMKNLAVIKESADRLTRITDDLLDYRRFTVGKFELQSKQIDLKNIIETSAKHVQPLLEKRRQNLKVEVPKHALHIQGDESRLMQVVMNLLENASKFSSENVDIRLRVERESAFFRVSITDVGIGIKKEDLSRVFEPFAAIQKSAYVKGTGLGLSVTKGLVEAHGGKIWAESEGEGKGSTFTFTLPERKTD